MDEFQVWLRPLGDCCRIRVQGAANAAWLLENLGETFSMKDADPARETRDADVFTFDVQCDTGNSRVRLEKALSELREVKLMMRPE